MTDGHRPPAVARFLGSLLWLPVVVAGFMAFLFVTEDLPASRPVPPGSPDHFVTVGQVMRDEGLLVAVRYHNKITSQQVTAEVEAWNRSLLPAVGERVRVAVRRDDPMDVRIVGDAMPLSTNAGLAVGAVLASLLPPVVRRWSVTRTERLVAADIPSFAMVGVVTRRRLRSGRCVVHLYPLDARPGTRPVCSVPLLTTAQAPLGRVLAMEVKGAPRPLGRVVARLGDRVLWPEGRALRTADHPRPEQPVEVATGLEPAFPPADPGRRGPLAARILHWEFGAFVVALACLAVVTTVTSTNVVHARTVERSGTPIIGEVVGHEADDTVVVLRYERSGKQQRTRAPALFASDYDKGIRYPARLDPANPRRARLDAEPYNRVEPMGWAGFFVVVSAALAGRRLRLQRRNRRIASAGPWWRADARVLEASSVRTRVALAGPDGSARCTVVLSSPPTAVHEPPASSVDHAGRPNVAVVVAGECEPGSPVAVWFEDGTPLAVVGPARADDDGPEAGLTGAGLTPTST